eukprot:182936_1
MAQNMRAGLTDLTKRTLPPMNYNHALFPIICDRVNDFARYALAFQQVAYRIQRQMKKNVFNAAPIQIDYWIIPRLTRARDMNQSIFFKQRYAQQNKPKYLKLAEDGDYGGDMWDIEALLTHRKLGYIKDVDYFVGYAPRDIEDLQHNVLFDMIKKHHLHQRGRNRYIMIIDRRDRDNIDHQELCNTNWRDDPKEFERMISSIEMAINFNVELRALNIVSNVIWRIAEYSIGRGDKIYMIGPKQYRNEEGKPLCICGAELRKAHIIINQ